MYASFLREIHSAFRKGIKTLRFSLGVEISPIAAEDDIIWLKGKGCTVHHY